MGLRLNLWPTRAVGGTNGWWIDLSNRTAGSAIEFTNGSNASFNTLEYMDLQGPGYITYSGDGRGIDATPFSSAKGNTFSHIKVWNWESAIYLAGIANTTFEYMEMYGVGAVNSATFHPNGLYTSGADGLIIRYPKFHSDEAGRGIGEGIFCEQSGGCAHWQIYGNIFSSLTSKVTQITSNVESAVIVNNTFVHLSYAPIEIRTDQGGACSNDSETRDNLFIVSNGYDACGTTSNNVSSSSQSLMVGNNDFHLTAALPGLPLTPTYARDADGLTRGSDGAWDVGAYEFSASDSKSPNAPINLRTTS